MLRVHDRKMGMHEYKLKVYKSNICNEPQDIAKQSRIFFMDDDQWVSANEAILYCTLGLEFGSFVSIDWTFLYNKTYMKIRWC